MKATAGSKYSIRGLGQLQWWCDLIEYEGPLLSLFHIENRSLYLASWFERKNDKDRWLLARVSDNDLRRYLSGEKSLRTLIKNSPLLLTYWQLGKSRRMVRKINWNDLDVSERPAADSYFEAEYATAPAQQLAREVSSTYNILIDGDWYLDDLSAVPRLFKQVYAFNHAVNNMADASVQARIAPGLVNRPFRGGYSVVNMIGDMGDAIPPISRVKVEAMSYHSPGYISLRADPKIAAGVERIMVLLSDSDNLEKLKAAYKEANNYLDDHSLRKLGSTEFNENEYSDFASMDARVRELSRQILIFLDHEKVAAPLLALDSGLTVLKALIAYVRRLFQLQRFVDDGLITKFGGPRRRGGRR